MSGYRKRPCVKKKRNEYLERTKEQRRKWAQEYYKKNKKELINKTNTYRKNNPNKVEQWNKRNRELGKGVEKGKREREELKPAYLKALIREEGSDKSVDEKAAEVLIYRIKKKINKISKNEK